MVFSMDKKLPVILSGIVLCGLGLYKGVIAKEPVKYSLEWIKELSDAEWLEERKIVQKIFRSPEYNDEIRLDAKKVLGLFDKVKSDRDWAGKVPRGPVYHREHGFNLYKKD